MSLVGGIVGLVFVFIGLFVAIPHVGAFGVLWTLIAVVITVTSLYNAFSDRGVATEIIEVSDDSPGESNDPEARLRRLDDLKAKSLITPAEYEHRRAQILNEL